MKMIWNHPSAFLALLALPVIIYFVARTIKRRNRAIETLFSEDIRGRLFVTGSRPLSTVKYTFLFLALIAFICAFAGPRFGREAKPRQTLGRDVFVLFDVSDSMLAEDVAPNRLTVAKLDVEDLLEATVGDRIGLVAFAGSSQVEIPLTTDYEFFRELLRKVDTNTVRLGGTAIGDAIRLALKRFGNDPQRKRLIVLITDGEDHDSLPLEAAKNAAEMKVPIITISLGSLAGAKIPVFNINGERVGYKMFDGDEALSKPDVETLKEIAKISGGQYFHADSRLDLANVYKASLEVQKRAEKTEDFRITLKNRYQPFLAFGLFSFMFYYFFPTRSLSGQSLSAITSVIMTLFFSSLSIPETFAQENASHSEKPVAQKLSKSREIRAYNESLKLAESDKEEFEKRQTEFASSDNTDVAGQANYNLGVARLKTAQKIAWEFSNASAKNAFQKDAPDNAGSNSAPENANQMNNDAVEEYNKARKERREKRRKLDADANDAAQNFFRASQSPRLAQSSNQNAEAVSHWASQIDKKERARELERRESTLSDPNDRLRWLKGELRGMLDSIHELRDNALNANYFRSLNVKKNEMDEWDPDIDAIATTLGIIVSFPPSQPHGVISSSNPAIQGALSNQTPDPEGASKLTLAKDNFLRYKLEASKRFAQYDANGAITELRLAETQLTPFHDVPLRYDALVSELALNEKNESQTLDNSAEKTIDVDKMDDYRWSRKSLSLSVDELMRKARQIVVENPPAKTIESDPATKLSENNPDDSLKEETEELHFDSNEVEAQTPTPSKTYEERALESAKIALRYEKELTDAVEKAGNICDVSSEQLNTSQELVSIQRKIADILQEIARPFQDENPQNRNQDQQNSNSQTQERENQDKSERQDKEQSSQTQDSQNKQQESKDENLPDELEKPEESADELEKPEESDSDESKEEDTRETSVEAKEPKDPKKKKASGLEKTEEQKEADELTRRVFRRQKDAEPQRNAVRQALKKREKSGKDW